MEDLISVMIPAYNAERYIKECLESLKNQTYKNIEIVIVNDGSTDCTQSICEEYVSEDNRFRLVNQENGGEGAARNRGLQEAKGKYLCFVDADDHVYPEFIENMYKMQQEYQAGMVICGFTELKDNEVINETSGEIQVMNQEVAMENLLKEDSFKGYVWNKMFDMDIIRKNQLQFDVSLAVWTDVLFVFQYLLDVEKVVFNPTPMYYYIYVPSSASHAANHLLGVEKAYSAIRAKEQMISRIPIEYDLVKKQISVRFVQSSLAVLRNIGYFRDSNQKYQKYMDNCRLYILKYRYDAYKNLSQKDRILVFFSIHCINLLMMLYHFAAKLKA